MPNEKLLPRLTTLKAGAHVFCPAFPLRGIVADRAGMMKSAEDGADDRAFLDPSPLKEEPKTAWK